MSKMCSNPAGVRVVDFEIVLCGCKTQDINGTRTLHVVA
jgi:hypothetical protein